MECNVREWTNLMESNGHFHGIHLSPSQWSLCSLEILRLHSGLGLKTQAPQMQADRKNHQNNSNKNTKQQKKSYQAFFLRFVFFLYETLHALCCWAHKMKVLCVQPSFRPKHGGTIRNFDPQPCIDYQSDR